MVDLKSLLFLLLCIYLLVWPLVLSFNVFEVPHGGRLNFENLTSFMCHQKCTSLHNLNTRVQVGQN